VNENDYLHKMMEKLVTQSEETQKCVVSLDKKVELHIQKTELRLQQIHELDEQQNEILEEHHKRSTELGKDNQLREKSLRIELERLEDKVALKVGKPELQSIDNRIEKLEQPRELIKSMFKLISYIGGATGAMYGVYQLIIEYIKMK